MNIDPEVPRVSFLIATHETGRQFERALQSCIEQTYSNFEVIVVANGVSDEQYRELLAICGCSPLVRVFRTSIRRLTFSLNLGLHEARGEYVARMDSDDLCYPTRLAEQVEYLDRHPDIGICGSWCDLIDTNDRVIGEWRYPLGDEAIKKALIYTNPICHPTVMFRKQVLAQHGGYSGFFAEDYVTWTALSIEPSVRFANIPKRLIAYRAPHAEHRRNLTWRKAKAVCAGMQVQSYGFTHNSRWLLGALRSILKTFLRAK